jgi:hypothetical protein
MSYLNIVQMAGSASLLSRIAAALAEEGHSDPQTFARENIWTIVAAAGWDEAWGYAVEVSTTNQNPDTGMREDVISDSMILAVVQPMVTPPSGP